MVRMCSAAPVVSAYSSARASDLPRAIQSRSSVCSININPTCRETRFSNRRLRLHVPGHIT